MEIDLSKIQQIHFIGIGGVGISAVANLLLTMDKNVTGSDQSKSPITEHLLELGISVAIGQKAENIPQNTDLVVYTIAATEDNPEMIEARKRGLPLLSYPQMLSIISKKMKTIAVSGTHGKTTTTAMLSKILIDAELDPTVIVGSLMKDGNRNLVVGKSNYFIVEACEYRRSFLNLFPWILVITNVDEDHLDYYKDLEDIQSAFRELAIRVPENGAIICNASDTNLLPIIEGLKCKIIDYCPYVQTDLKLKVPGKHNRENVAVGIALTSFLKLDQTKSKLSLEDFNGTWRRFDLRGKTQNGTLIYDDYAHHPQEIIAALSSLKEKYPKSKRVAFFQPHLFSRTKSLLNEFANSFGDADQVYILPIFASREEFDSTINSSVLVNKIGEKASYVENFDKALELIKTFDAETVVMNIGAGDIYKLSEIAVVS